MNYGENEEQVSDKYEKGRNILYVAITRTIKNLRVLYIDDFEEIKDGIKKFLKKQTPNFQLLTRLQLSKLFILFVVLRGKMFYLCFTRCLCFIKIIQL